MDTESKNTRVIQSIQRAVDIIECFTNNRIELSLHEISTFTSLNKSTAHGIINTLVVNGYISQNNENGKYLLGNKFISKSLIVSTSLLVKNIGEKYLEAISDKFSVTSHLMMYERKELYTLKLYLPATSYYIISSIIGKRIPFHATASGKIILLQMDDEELQQYIARNPMEKYTDKTITNMDVLKRELDKIRHDGYSFEDEEVEYGVFSIACPIYNQVNRVLGTISISASLSIDHSLPELIQCLKNAANQISQDLKS
jgi:DNA-binding IclR family transcriptional regulator